MPLTFWKQDTGKDDSPGSEAQPEVLEPVEQIQIVLAELYRQRLDASKTMDGMRTRATFLITASGIFGAFHSVAVIGFWQTVGTVLLAVAAGVGIWVLIPKGQL